jgi:plasmid stability protein
MRTTLNLDEDVAGELAARARRDGRSMSRVANELIRAGVLSARRPERMPAYDPPTFDTGQPLVDVTDVAEVLELLDRG